MSQFIDGKTCDALSGKPGVVRDPSSGEVVAETTLAGAEDVDRAVQAARNAYAEWSRGTPAMRSAVLTTFARLLSDRAEEIAQLESRIAGKPIRLASEFDVPGTIDNVAFFAGAARNLEGKATAEYSPDHTSSIRREPLPHGGMKESGFGKDMSSYSFDDYTVVKHVMYDGTGVAAKPWHRTIFANPGSADS